MDWALNLIKKQLVTPITLMPQNTNGYALSCSSLIVAHRAHDSGRLLMINIPQQLAKHLIELWKLTSREKASQSISTWFLYALNHRCGLLFFSNRVLPWSSVRQKRSIAIVSIICGRLSLWGPFDKLLKGGNPLPVLYFLCDDLQILEWALFSIQVFILNIV